MAMATAMPTTSPRFNPGERMEFLRLASRFCMMHRTRRNTLRAGQVVVLGLLSALLFAAADPPERPLEQRIPPGASAQERELRAGQLRLMALAELCPKEFEILIWKILPDWDEVRIVFARSTDSSEFAYATPWNDLVLLIDRTSLPGILMAEATEPMPTPIRGSGVGAWDRWVADSRVEVALLDREEVLQQGWIPHTDRRSARSKRDSLLGLPNRTPVAPFSGR